MTIAAANRTEKHIVKELARLRMWRDVATSDECQTEDEMAHDRINSLLDLWEDQHSDTAIERDSHPTVI